MTVLITGGAGFIGSHLVAYYLKKGERVLVVDVSDDASSLAALGVSQPIIKSDLSEPGGFDLVKNEDVDLIFHLAGSANVPVSVREPVFDFKSNVVSTLNVLELARSQGGIKVVFPSTSSVYRPGARLPLRETSPVRPSSPYGAAKYASEGYCFAYHETYGLATVVLRFFNVYGPLMRRWVVHDLVRKLQRDPSRLEILGDGDQLREYLYVDDAVDALVLAAEKGEPGEVYNAGTGNPVRIKDLALEIIERMGLGGVELHFTMESWPGDIREWYADTTKFSRLGFSPKVARSEGLAKTVEYLLESGGHGKPMA